MFVVTKIEDITIITQAKGDKFVTTRAQSQGAEPARIFYEQATDTLVEATASHLDAVANEIALHADNGMVELSNASMTISLPDYV